MWSVLDLFFANVFYQTELDFLVAKIIIPSNVKE